MIEFLAVRTFYPQWASRSGIHQYLRYLDRSRFSISEKLVPMGDSLFPVKNGMLRGLARKALRRLSGNGVYGLNDFVAEAGVYARSVSGRADIVQYFDSEHTLGFLPRLLGRPFCPGRKRPKLVGMFHQPPGVLRELVSLKAARRLDCVVLMSSAQKEFFSGAIPEEKVHVLLHGIDTDYYRPDLRKKGGDAFKCVTVGSWLRDYETLRLVAESLRGEPVRFHVVSGTHLEGAPANLTVHRGLTDDELLGLYQGADLLFMPMKDATANNALLEGIACGLPVLTTDLPSTREYLENSGSLFVSGNEVDAFRGHILELARNKERCAALGTSSRRRALELAWPRVAGKYQELYLGLVKRVGQAR